LNSLTDITNLYTSILSSLNAPAISPSQPSTNDKNIFVKAKDWVKDQRNEISRDNLKEKPVATVLRGA
jgi:hypothetical protein